MRRCATSPGYSLVELSFVLLLIGTMGGVAMPQLAGALDDYRAAGAVRYLTMRLASARMEAIGRSADVAVRFTPDAGGWAFAVYLDGNRNGVRTRDIDRGIDRRITPIERLTDNFPGVAFAVPAGLPAVDTGPATDGDPLKLGAGNLLSFSALGSSSSGSVYVRGRRGSQYVIRAFGETGKVRALKLDRGGTHWTPL